MQSQSIARDDMIARLAATIVIIFEISALHIIDAFLEPRRATICAERAAREPARHLTRFH